MRRPHNILAGTATAATRLPPTWATPLGKDHYARHYRGSRLMPRRIDLLMRWGIALGAFVLVASCAPSRGAQQPTLEHRTSRYQLQSQDILTVSFPLSPEFDETVTVQPDGYIGLLGAADLFVQGLTLPGLQDALQHAYSKVLNQPIINVTLKDFQTPFFVVSGQVAKPGQFSLRYDTTVSSAIALAGGLTPAAKSHIFLLRRSSAGWFKVTPLSFKDIVNGKPVEDALLQSGDMLYVPEKFITKFRTYVPYSIGVYASPQLLF